VQGKGHEEIPCNWKCSVQRVGKVEGGSLPLESLRVFVQLVQKLHSCCYNNYITLKVATQVLKKNNDNNSKIICGILFSNQDDKEQNKKDE